MADNTDTELIDWLMKQEAIAIQREPKTATRGNAMWYIRVGGIAVWEADLRRAVAVIRELKGEPKTARKGK